MRYICKRIYGVFHIVPQLLFFTYVLVFHDTPLPMFFRFPVLSSVLYLDNHSDIEGSTVVTDQTLVVAQQNESMLWSQIRQSLCRTFGIAAAPINPKMRLCPQMPDKAVWVRPSPNRYLLFEGHRLHGVLPDLDRADGNASSTLGKDIRNTLLINYWANKPESPVCCELSAVAEKLAVASSYHIEPLPLQITTKLKRTTKAHDVQEEDLKVINVGSATCAKQELIFDWDAEQQVQLVLPVELGSLCVVRGMDQFRFIKDQFQ